MLSNVSAAEEETAHLFPEDPKDMTDPGRTEQSLSTTAAGLKLDTRTLL